ncbi:hypothetical protein SAMN04488490_0260 [Marinobacter sp. LV10R510-11A]|uniref:hypothetical protein n=1 Tax=Marinobacter sp. LV10R510-11A TaxID=1415568 RepID=UPI000BB71E95|nr:hypothetical protein [Marinobacter sp. LV10R510-11A]SOB74734.1 hypothetical protein SAMN04488490_0260 [Marinobacter sp. LV10R510-11A]
MTAKRSILTAKEWEECLQHHYLRTDGPSGSTPLDSLDATPSELRTAAGLEDLSDEEILSAFMAIFSRDTVRKVLGTEVSKYVGSHVYHRFHFLVLTCVVSATTTEAGDSGNFRERLGVLFDDGNGQEQQVQGVNSLWRSLARWIDNEISKGEPFRRIVLPEPGNMTQIGYAVRLAYPSRNDRSQLKSVLKRLPERALENRYVLFQQLSRESAQLPERMQNDLRELEMLYRQSGSFEQNSFWRLIENVLAELSQSEPGRSSLLWCLSLAFTGWDGDEIEASLARGNRRSQLDYSYWSGSFEELLNYSNAPLQVKKLLNSGVVILHEIPGGLWVQDDRKAPEDCRVIVLSCLDDVVASMRAILTAGRYWKVTEPMTLAEALELTRGKGIVKKEVSQPSVQLEGGVPLGRGKWLNRPGLLPYIRLHDCRQLTIIPEVALRYEGGVAIMEDSSPTDGRRRMDASASDASIFKTSFQLLRNAPLATRWAARSERHEESVEVRFEGGPFLTDGAHPFSAGLYPNRFADVLEAIYARAGSPRPEGEIVQLIKRVVPSSVSPWDIQRSLEEAGWIAQDLNRQWRGRFWRVMPPHIVLTGGETALVEGALGSAELDLLTVEAKKVSVAIMINAENPWAVPVVGLVGDRIPEVAEKLDYKIYQAKIPKLRPAPACWLEEKRTTQGRECAGIWHSELKKFIPGDVNKAVTWALSRFIRDDDRDVYSVRGKSHEFVASQRVVAFLEYSRLSRKSQFEWFDSILRSKRPGGHLPLPVAQWLRRASFVQTGPALVESGQSHYLYGVSLSQVNVLTTIFGEAISLQGLQSHKPAAASLAIQRRRGERLSIYKHGGAGFYG